MGAWGNIFVRDEFKSAKSKRKEAESAAFEAGLGRWQPDACGPVVAAELAITDLEPDAPGDDSANANGEWIEIANRGDAAADLTGWAIQDESSSHRFGFPSDFVLRPADTVRIYSGCGQQSITELYWCDTDPVWTNRGDTAYLLDPSGNVVDRRAF